MRKTWLFVALVSVLVLSIAFPIFAQERSSPPREEEIGKWDRIGLHQNIGYSLNLSQEQKIKILEVWEKYRPNIRICKTRWRKRELVSGNWVWNSFWRSSQWDTD